MAGKPGRKATGENGNAAGGKRKATSRKRKGTTSRRKAAGGTGRAGTGGGRKKAVPKADSYEHSAKTPMRPDVGTQPQFRKKKPPATYRYDSSLSPTMDWDGQNAAREHGEWLLACIEEAAALPAPHRFDQPRKLKNAAGDAVASVEGLTDAVEQLKALSEPFLNWAGKAERQSFEVPTLPLFVHERLSTEAIIETLRSHKRDKQLDLPLLFADPQHSVSDQVLKAYEYQDAWVNRLILGDSLVVMNSLLRYESMGGKVQMIYMDPPYGVKYGSNFQPFVRKRGAEHNKDEDLTREPEMVKAYRDTWELGLHSWLTYVRDRLYLCHDLLCSRGSIFVQVNDVNVHHVREMLDDVFGEKNFVSQISFQTTTGFKTNTLATLGDFLLWYAKDKERVKVRSLYLEQPAVLGEGNAKWLLLPDGSYRGVTAAERRGEVPVPENARPYGPDNMISQGASREPQPYEFQGKTYEPGGNSHWKANYPIGMSRLAAANRIHVSSNSLRYRRFHDDFPYRVLGNIWTDTITGQFTRKKAYAVRTNPKVVERCLLLTSDPGDLVLDPTCGGGTTPYAAEKWGRRWITIDVSRVPTALARQRLLTDLFPWFRLADEERGPVGGFVYERRQNRKGEEIGGIVPHIELETIANNERPEEVVLVDRPETDENVTRVTGPFVVEATIPTPVDWEGDGVEDARPSTAEAHGDFTNRMLEVLRKSPVLHLPDNETVTLEKIRRPAKSLSLSAEAVVSATAPGQSPTLPDAAQEAAERNGLALPMSAKPVAIVFGPENGAVSENLVYAAAREAHAKDYTHLYVIGFSIQPNARKLVDTCEEVVGIRATYVQATPDILMGDLLKNMRSSQIFSVCGLPEVEVRQVMGKDDEARYEVELLGLDVFDPTTMEAVHKPGNDVPAWLLDTDYNGLCFHVCQAFFPRTKAWESIKKALKATHDESVWEHLAGTTSAPFEAGEHGQVAVKVIDDRGNELLVVKKLGEAAR